MTDQEKARLKHKARTLAAGIARPVNLHEAAAEVVRQLSAVEILAIVTDTVVDWIMSNDEAAIVPGRGAMLLGPAADPDDLDAWDAE
jgi:hypothetical protein